MLAKRVATGYAVGPGQGVPHRGRDVKASGQCTGGTLTVIEITIDGGPPRHTHTHEDESLYIFTGSLDVRCGEDRTAASGHPPGKPPKESWPPAARWGDQLD